MKWFRHNFVPQEYQEMMNKANRKFKEISHE